MGANFDGSVNTDALRKRMGSGFFRGVFNGDDRIRSLGDAGSRHDSPGTSRLQNVIRIVSGRNVSGNRQG